MCCAPHRKQWLLVREKSTFVDWQRVKVQELSEEVRAVGGHCKVSLACVWIQCSRLHAETT
jgi:DNA replicative helicase MCM subunit Mcm2 (Cdc46/Mcm family)